MLHLKRTANRYQAALRDSPPGGKAVGWPVAYPESGGLAGLGGWGEDLLNAVVPGASSAVASAQQQVAQLKMSLQIILGLSAVAATTGVLIFLRGK
jgi:hypothetical protein